MSSSTRILGLASTARASASRCRWPPESASPCSPIRVSSPQGRSWTKPAWAMSSACSISASVAGRLGSRPRVRFSRALIENSVGSSNAVATSERRWPQVELADVDAVDGDPAAGDVVEPRHQGGEDGLAGAGGADQRDGLARPDLEVDAAQHRARRSRGTRSRRARTAGGPRGCSMTRSPDTMSGSVSKISRIRAAARSSPPAPSPGSRRARRPARPATASGVMNATSSPGVSSPLPTPIAPSSSTTTTARLGITSRNVQNLAESRTLSMLVRVQLAGRARRTARRRARRGRTT